MKPLLILLVLILGPFSTARSGDANWANDELAKEAPQKLKAVKEFAIGGVGYVGTISQPELWFRAMIQRPDAVIECQKLISNATPAGQLYGLLGLRQLDQKAFVEALPKFKDSKTPVTTLGGCMVLQTTVATITARIIKGAPK